jgi:hypothetical protein
MTWATCSSEGPADMEAQPASNRAAAPEGNTHGNTRRSPARLKVFWFMVGSGSAFDRG